MISDGIQARYLDGELPRDAADRFLAALAADPDLAADLAGIESAMRLLVETPCSGRHADGDGRTERIMAAVHSCPRHRVRRRPVPRTLSWAAVLVVAVGLGWVMGERGAPGRPGRGPAAPYGLSAQSTAEQSGLRFVRLVFGSSAGDATPVGVAGTFNDWDATRAPFHRENGNWVAYLVLPPAVYEYVFVMEDGRWLSDPAAVRTRNDGFGSRNSVLELEL